MIKQTKAADHATVEIAMHVLETFWVPRYTCNLYVKV